MKETGYNNEIDFARITLLYKNAYFNLFGVLVVFLELLYIISDVLQPQLVWLISIAGFILLLPRIGLFLSFNLKLKKSIITFANIKKWEIWWSVSILPFALLVSLLVYFPFEKDQLIIFLFIGIAITGLGVGSLVISSTSIITALPFFSIISFPFILRCFSEDNHYYHLLGSMGLIGYLIFTRLLFRLNKNTVESIKLQIKNKNNALKDPLTGLWNRRRLNLYIEEIIPQSIRSKVPFSIILLDIDHFKKVNDTLGHDAGDEILKTISQWLTEISRDQDLVVRYGGEEFMIVMPAADIESATKLTSRIIDYIKASSNQTISAGIARYSEGMDFNQLFILADNALYNAKETGRNKFVIAADAEN